MKEYAANQKAIEDEFAKYEDVRKPELICSRVEFADASVFL